MRVQISLLLMLLQVGFGTAWAQNFSSSEKAVHHDAVKLNVQKSIEQFPIQVCNRPHRSRDSFLSFRGEAYFCGIHHEKGKELFRSNGTNSGTNLVFDIDKGPGSSSPDSLFELNDHLFFFAENTLQGVSLWRTDGSADSTKRIKEISGATSTKVKLVETNADYIIFQVAGGDSLLPARNLWRTDGTYEGTYKLDAEVFDGAIQYLSLNLPASSFYKRGDELFYSTLNTIYRLDLITNTSQAIKTFPDSREYQLRILDGKANSEFLIEYSIPSPLGELWVSDGTATGTIRLFSNVNIMGISGTDVLACSGDDKKLLALNKTGQKVLYSFERNEKKCRQQLYSLELWEVDSGILIPTLSGVISTDFTPEGTIRINSDFMFVLGTTNEKTIIADACCNSSRRLFSSDGTNSGTNQIGSIDTGSFSRIRGQDESGRATSQPIFFIDNRGIGSQLWRTDGSQSGTAFVKRLPGWIEYIGHEDQRHFFSVNSDEAPYQLWHSDGTGAGTYQLFYEKNSGLEQSNKSSGALIAPVIYYLLNEKDETNLENQSQ